MWAEDEVTAFTITSTKPGEIITLPRQTITLPFFVQNNTTQTRECLSEIIPPENWKVILAPMPFTLASTESTLALATIFVPRGTGAEIHYVTYKVSDKNKPTVTEFLMLPIRVLPSHHIIVEHIDAPKYVIAGNSITSIFTIINQGNTAAHVDVQIYSMDNLPCAVIPLGDDRSITLAPATSQQLEITVETDGTMKDVLEYRLEVKVKVKVDEGVETGDDQIGDRASCKTNIIPRISGTAGLFHLLPITLGIRGESYFNDTVGVEGKVSVKSEGTLDEKNIHNIELRIEKAVNTTDDLLVNPEDFYFFRYWNSFFDIYLGDYTYYLSPLLEKHTFGRGVGTSVLLGPFAIGSYYHRDPSTIWDTETGTAREGIDHVAGYLDFIIPEPTYAEGFLYKASLNCYTTVEEHLILGIRQQYKPFQYFNFDLDLASGLNFNEESPLGYAIYFDSDGAHKWFSYKFNGVYADPFFPGTYKDLYIIMGNLGFHFLNNRLKFNTTYEQQQRNISLDESLVNAYIERNAILKCFYSFGEDLTSLSLAWKYQNKIDQSPEPEYLFYDNGIHMTLFQPIHKFALNLDGEFRYLFDTINDSDSFHHKYHSSLDYAPEEKQVYTFSLAYNGDYYSDRADYHKLSASANYQYSVRDFSINAQLENTYTIQDWNIDYFSLGISAGLTYNLIADQTLSANSAYTLTSTGGYLGHDAFLIIEYKAPFSIPISKKMSIGSVNGVIVDETTGEGVENVIIHLNGFATVTGANGEFAFNAIQPGTHYINIDRGGIKKNYIPTALLPMKIEVEKGKELEVKIGVIEGAVVRGQVLFFKENKKAGFVVADDEENLSGSGFPFVLLELSNGEKVMRRLSDKNGQFSFDEVLPGKWTLQIVSHNYPEYHYIEKDTFDLDVTEGDLVAIEFKILPEERKISFLNVEDTLYIRPPDEDMVYELEWKADPTPEPEKSEEPDTDVTPEPTIAPTEEPQVTPEPTPLFTGEPQATPEPTPLVDEPQATPEITPIVEEPTKTPESTPLIKEPEVTLVPEESPIPSETENPTPLPGETTESTPTGTPITVLTTTFAPTLTPEPTPVSTEAISVEPIMTPILTPVPTPEPTSVPTSEPTIVPTPEPTIVPTPEPTIVPTPEPTSVPTPEPTSVPTSIPTVLPTPVKTPVPTPVPTIPDIFDEVPPPKETLSPDEVPPPKETLEPEGIPPPKDTIKSDSTSLFDEIPPPSETLEP